MSVYMQCGVQMSCFAAAMHPQDSSTGGIFAGNQLKNSTGDVWLSKPGASSVPSWCVAPKGGACDPVWQPAVY